MITMPAAVRGLRDRQFITGTHARRGALLPEEQYAAALDALVIVCVDVIPLHAGRMLVSRRTWLPHADWWVNGGRMRAGEHYGEAAARLMRAEIGLDLAPERFRLVGHYNLIWDQRAQEPREYGCHTLSATHAIELDADEVGRIRLNEEYDGSRWVTPEADC